MMEGGRMMEGGWMNGLMGKWVNGSGMDGWEMDRGMDGWIDG